MDLKQALTFLGGSQTERSGVCSAAKRVDACREHPRAKQLLTSRSQDLELLDGLESRDLDPWQTQILLDWVVVCI